RPTGAAGASARRAPTTALAHEKQETAGCSPCTPRGRTIPLTCPARTSELHVEKSPHAGQVRCSAWFGSALAVTPAGHTVTPQREPEHQPVCDQEQRYHDGRNEVSGAQLTRLDPDTDQTLIECVEQNRATPKVEHPDQADSQPALEPRQGEHGQDGGNEIAVCSRASERARQVRRDHAGHQEG